MNIGIAGNGKIVSEMITAANSVEDICISAICCRPQSKEKAQALADKYSISKIYTDYQEMLHDTTLDFIYIAVVNNLHYTYAKQALLAGKNVICEKPFTITSSETAELIDLAKSKNLFLFEAITLFYSPNFQYLKDNLHQIAPIRYVQANYAQYSSRYDRYLNKDVAPAFDPKLAGGSLYDLNIYNLHFIVGLFGKPNDVIYRPNFGFNHIDTSGTVLLDYDGFTAVCNASKDSESISGIVFQGENGYIELLGAPNECALIRLNPKNKFTKLVNKERHNHRMIDEFIAFNEIFKQQDFTTCYNNLDHSLKVMQVLEQARINGNLKFA